MILLFICLNRPKTTDLLIMNYENNDFIPHKIYQIGVIDISNKHYRFYFLNKNHTSVEEYFRSFNGPALL